MAKKILSRKITKKYPERAADVPVTQTMLYLVRDELKADFSGRFEKISSELHRVALLVEVQTARNTIVLDGLTSLFTRQERVESQVDKLAGILISLK